MKTLGYGSDGSRLAVATPRYATPVPAQAQQHHTDLLVIGSGAAGLAAALAAAEQADVLLLTRATLAESNSAWAQGGIAAALEPTDSPAAHLSDTLIAGAGLTDMLATDVLVHEAPALMRQLAALGVPFERADSGQFALGLEGGHSHRRILHSGDTTGWAITSTLLNRALAHPRIRVYEGMHAVDLRGERGRCTGVLALDSQGQWHTIVARATILATGGAGALYGLTSNQPHALGEGIALAYRAGAAVADLEFVQFHPTVFRTQTGHGFLISEATRGEGGILRDVNGWRFMPDFDPRAELAPRDIVSRAIFATMQQHASDHVLLDLTHLGAAYLEHRFPTIVQRCRSDGLDPATTPIPVAPAAHYLMGGICTDTHGATSLAGLYAAGECACTGIHGANRLASNSLLECLVFGRRAARAALAHIETGMHTYGAPLPRPTHTPVSDPVTLATAWREELAQTMVRHVGVQRDAPGLLVAQRHLAQFPLTLDATHSTNHDLLTAINAGLVARLMVTSALLREESRGAHQRTDFPHTDPAWQVHIVQERGQLPHITTSIADDVLYGAIEPVELIRRTQHAA